ncbi:sugar ABC transporter permease [Natronosporangium hydrolyticum]|uniref:Sugar ABC transporter permease n=1 Tax=Natronosporangium hydrolyticum TaxID=2811111 RepID=A0A895Y8Q7_9ACTN|nr:sugar ABC transporter permease [Natronosporangium hydrolyticum]QSB13721.1 sugar ABC transporter permease [Natronosporangium hydrolyticum]
MTGTSVAPDPGTRSGAGGGGRGSPRAVRQGLSEKALGRIFISPSIALMSLVALFPVIWAFVLSLYVYTRRQPEGFGGFDNYVTALTNPRFWDSLQFTFVFTLSSVTLEFVIGMGFALLMNQAFRGRGVTRAAILIPWVIPTVVAAQMWFFMFNVTPGFINTIFGLGNFNWLGQSGTAAFAIIFADVWKTAPFVALLLLAGLQTIPNDVYESGKVDGAGPAARFFHITLPLLKPAILVALLFRTVDALRVYDLPQVMTRGAFDTESLSMLVQQYVVRTPNPGLGAALSTITFVLILGIGIIFVRLLGRDLVIGREEGK